MQYMYDTYVNTMIIKNKTKKQIYLPYISASIPSPIPKLMVVPRDKGCKQLGVCRS